MATPSTSLIETAKSNAQLWLQEEFDEQTKREVKKLLDSESEELLETFGSAMEFGTAGLRGIMGTGI